MAIRNIRRQATNPLAAPGTPTSAPIYVDSDDNILKMIPAGSGTTEVQVADVSSTQTFTNKTLTSPVIGGDLGVSDDLSIELGTDDDTVLRHKSATLAATTALTDVIVGTPVTPALAANSFIVSNTTADGDILIATQTGGNSQAAVWVDASAGETRLYGAGTNSLIASATAATAPDDILLAVGGANDARLSWDTTDANANEMLIQLPAGGATNVPVIAIGQSIESVDLGLYNGVVDPRIAVFGVGAVTTAPVFEFRKARGTIASPTVCTTGDDLGTLDFYGAVAAGEYVRGASIRADIAGTIATTRGPGTLTFMTATDAAPSVMTNALVLGADQNAVLGGGAASQTLTFDTSGTDVVLSASSAALAMGAITLNVTGTRFVTSYHTNLVSTNAVTVDSSVQSKVESSIKDYDKNATDIINGIRVVDYQHKLNIDPTGKEKLGIIAETLAEPLALNTIENPEGGSYPGVNMMGLMALLVKQSQELNARIAKLEQSN